MRLAARMVLLVALWLLAWGDVSLGNVVGGVAVAAALLVAFPVDPAAERRLRVRPVGVARLLAYVVSQLVTSNVVMTREILRRRVSTTPGVLAHRLESPSEVVITIMANIISLSPGTITVDVDAEAATIYVHVLFLDDVEEARAMLAGLERLARAAIEPRNETATTARSEAP